MKIGVIVAALFTSEMTLVAQNTHFSPLRPVAIDSFEHPEFVASLPVIDILLDHKSRLWVLGKSSLWMFELLNQQLVRIKIENLHHPLQAMSINGVNLFATNGRTLYAISLDDPSQVRRFDSKLAATHENRCLNADDTFVIWDHEQGQRIFNIAQQTFFERATSSRQHCGIIGFGKYWQLQGTSQLLAFSIAGNARETVDLDFPVTSLARTNDSVVVWNENAIQRYGFDLQAAGKFRVQKPRRLAFADFVDPIQAYLLRDGALEIHDIEKKSVRYYNLAQVVPAAAITHFRSRKHVAAIATDQKIHVVQLLDADK